MKKLLPLLCLLLGSPILAAVDYHVSPSGDDVSGDGSAAAPWRSITRAMTATLSGDRILVGAGTYGAFTGEGFPIVVRDGVSLLGPASGSGTATLDGSVVFTPILVIGDLADPTLIQNLRIVGRVDVIEVFGNPADLQVLDCVFLGGWRALNHTAAGDAAALVFSRNTVLGMEFDGVVWEATGGAGLDHVLTLNDNRFFGEKDSADGIRLAANGEVVVDAAVQRNLITGFGSGIRVVVSASGSSATLSGSIDGNDVDKCDDNGLDIALSASGIGPSVASFDAVVRFNSLQKSGDHGLRIDLSALGPNNLCELRSAVYGNLIRRNVGSGVFLSDSELGGGVCDTQPDLGGGSAGSWGGNTLERNDDDYATGVQFDLRLESSDPVSVRDNWWGVLDPLLGLTLEQRIFHQVDDPLAGLADFSVRRLQTLRFRPVPGRAGSVDGSMVTLFADPGTVFVDRGGVVPVSVAVGGILSQLVNVAADGRSLTFRVPNLRTTGGGTLPLEVVNPGAQSGLSSIIIEGDRQGGGFCFVATATFGHPDAPEVLILRQLRDRSLLTHAFGRSLVRAYYQYSPPLAAWIARRPWAQTGARLLLLPVVGLSFVWLTAPWLYALAAALLLRRWQLRRRRWRRLRTFLNHAAAASQEVQR